MNRRKSIIALTLVLIASALLTTNDTLSRGGRGWGGRGWRGGWGGWGGRGWGGGYGWGGYGLGLGLGYGYGWPYGGWGYGGLGYGVGYGLGYGLASDHYYDRRDRDYRYDAEDAYRRGREDERRLNENRPRE